MSWNYRPRQQGFTLIELLMVIVVLGVIGAGTFAYLGFGAQIFTDVVGREQLSAQSRFAIERLSRELRNSLPGSARTFTPGGSSTMGGWCIEYLPIRGSGIYLAAPQAGHPVPVSIAQNIASIPDSDNSTLSANAYEGLYFFIAANNQARIYAPDSNSRAQIGVGAVDDLDTHYEIVFDNDVGVNRHSPARRYFLTSAPVAWCVEGNSPPYSLVHYSHYSTFSEAGMPTLASLRAPGAVRTKMADFLFNDTSSPPFRAQIANLSSNNLILIDWFFARHDGQEPLVIHHEVHVPNVP